MEDLLQLVPYMFFFVINSFEVRFHRHRIPFTLILPLAIPLLLELAVEKKSQSFSNEALSSWYSACFTDERFSKESQYLKRGRYGDTKKSWKLNAMHS